MIEKFCIAIVEELGATGVLLLGLTIIAFHLAREISGPLKVINQEMGEVRNYLKKIAEALEKFEYVKK